MIWDWGRVSLHGPQPPPAVPTTPTSHEFVSPHFFFLGEPESRWSGLPPRRLLAARLTEYTFGGSAQVDAWLGDRLVVLDPEAAVRWGFADEIGGPRRAREVVLAYARGETVRSPRREALAALGRGDGGGR